MIAGCPTAEVSIYRTNDPGVPSNWQVSRVNAKDDDLGDVLDALNRIVAELQKHYRQF